MRKLLFGIFIIVWTGIWMASLWENFSLSFETSRKLFNKSRLEKWEYVLGPDLYKFLSKCNDMIPDYENVVFIDKLSLFKKVRALYFLYPRVTVSASKDSRFIIVYKSTYPSSRDGKIIYTQGPDMFIIER